MHDVLTKAGRVFVMALVVVTVGCDRVTKHLATTHLAGEPPQSYFSDTVRLDYVENAGGFLSLGATWPAWARTGLFTIGTGAMLILLAFVVVSRRLEPLALISAGLFIAGSASNLVDRVVRGSVVDFMNVGIGPLRTGIFNVADVAIMFGVALFVVASASGRSHST